MKLRRHRISLPPGAVHPQVLWVIAYVAGAFGMAFWLWHRTGYWWGALLGLMLGVLVMHFGIHLVLYLIEMIWLGRPPIPDCRRGRCGGSDYYLDVQQGQKTYLCRCGVRYRRRGRCYVEVATDGREIPFLRWRPFRGWFPDFNF